MMHFPSESYNDRFLEETNDQEDTLNTEPDRNANDSIAKEVIEILDDETPVASSSDNNTAGTSLPNKIVLYKNKDKAPIHYAPLKETPNKPIILRHIKQLSSDGRQNAVKFIPVSSVKPQPTAKIRLNLANLKILPETAISKNLVAKSAIGSTPVSVRPIAPVAPRTYTVNKTKYLNVNDLKKSRIEQNLKRNRPQSDDDDDCVLVEEENGLGNIKEIVSTNNHKDSSMKFKTTLPSSISIKSVSGGESSRTVERPTLVAKVTTRPPANSNALVPVQPQLRVREFGKISDELNVDQGKVFRLIKLMISENQLLLGRHTGQLVRIARTKSNEFKIANTIYYYRTDAERERNYFFMNITRQPQQVNEIIQRCYAIYWGSPRRGCVGVVETKGVLDDKTKDFVFQQVKKSLFNEKSPPNINSPARVQPAPLILHNMAPQGRVPTNSMVGVKPIKVVSAIAKSQNDTGKDQLTINLDEDGKNNPQSSNTFQPYHVTKDAVQSPIRKNTATYKTIKSIAVQSPISKRSATSKTTFDAVPKRISKSSATSKPTFDAFPTRPVIKKLSTPEKANVKTPPRVKPKKKPAKRISPKDATANNELIRLSHFLTPTIRNLINKLKYFELKSGKVFTVKVGDSISKDKPFNIVFTENKPQFLADIRAKPVPTSLYVSKLVNYLFDAIYPYMRNRRREPIPIPPPQDIISDATPEVMEALLISESKRTYKEIAKLEASVNNSHATQDTSDYKHKCRICSQTFQRKYQLQRHKFVTHDSKPGEKSAESSPSSTSNVLSTIPDTIRNAFHDLETESCPDDLPLTTAIKTEKPEETILSDRSLLVPLYEELINEVRDDISLVKCKQEPEEHFEMTTLPLSTDNGLKKSNRPAKKRNFETNNGSGDETDSAPECLQTSTDAMEERRRTFEEFVALERQRQEKATRIAKVKDTEKERKTMRSKRSKAIGHRKAKKNLAPKMVPRKPIKLSRANKLIKQWPSLTVDLIDIKMK
ncbi:uncharacterized protein LOC119071719 isoform X2 [Bradysia coprophila]|uniref:uncharacterized protein LOC119071719 isoform X2 n=1 Tax=Bradysia coprophila TaxID=38358 RepID=UPI00187D6FA1|nr:uncharacterized protein LOC119071719 isoform X2 [Bradysia coprophila]